MEIDRAPSAKAVGSELVKLFGKREVECAAKIIVRHAAIARTYAVDARREWMTDDIEQRGFDMLVDWGLLTSLGDGAYQVTQTFVARVEACGEGYRTPDGGM